METTLSDKHNKRLLAALVGCALALSLALGGALAYLTDTASVVNDLSLDTNLSISLSEPNWDPANATRMIPTKTIDKDPTITNDGTVDEWVFAKVSVPVFTGSVANEEGKSVDVVDNDLFFYTVNAGWTQQGEPTISDGFRTYCYVYDSPLSANQSTSSIFDEITTANLTRGLSMTDTQIIVEAFAMQKVGFETAQDAMAAYNAQAGAEAASATSGA